MRRSRHASVVRLQVKSSVLFAQTIEPVLHNVVQRKRNLQKAHSNRSLLSRAMAFVDAAKLQHVVAGSGKKIGETHAFNFSVCLDAIVELMVDKTRKASTSSAKPLEICCQNPSSTCQGELGAQRPHKHKKAIFGFYGPRHGDSRSHSL